METSIDPTQVRGPSHQPSHTDQKIRPPFMTFDFEMEDFIGIKTTKWSRDRKKPKRLGFDGWRGGVTICASTAATVLILNIGLTIWASAKNGLSNGLATIQDGSCQKTKDLSLWLHLVINVLSTVLLAASNYCMQCLSSPTREDIDRAHSRHIWLDIGVPSIRNLRSIARNRIVLWWFLAFSGIPLHLLYNSAVFSTLSSQEYEVYIAADELVSGIGINWTASDLGLGNPTPADIYQNTSNWQKLTNEECIRAYGLSFVSARSNVLAITSNLNASDPLKFGSSGDRYDNSGPVYRWMCSAYPNLSGTNDAGCDINGLSRYSSNWELVAYDVSGSEYHPVPIQYCLSQPVEEHCRLQLSLIIMCIVMFCNFMKALCMYSILRHQKSPPLVTLGDAIESFLQDKDLTTENMCLADKYTFAAKKWDISTRTYLRKPHKWASSASWKRWLTCNILCISTLIVAGILLGIGLQNTSLQSRNISHLWSLGFGAVTSESLVAWDEPGSGGLWDEPGSGGLLLTVLVANSPQALLSFLFLTYNGLYTCMLMANDWSDYAYERKPLRVTKPVGDQRSTYRLQLPYKYGIPLTVLSGTLHWLVSQSLFLSRVESFANDGEEGGLLSTVGYSCIAIITVIILGTIVVALGILNGFRKYRPGMPLVGSCSAAISAACHRPREDIDAATLPVLWGAVSGQEEGALGHCCITSFEASPPMEGELYAGQYP